jgi:hypothetical protein
MGRELPRDMQPIFDYGSLNEDHKKAAAEICELLRQAGNEVMAGAISQRFKLEEPVRFDHTSTEFANACARANIFLGVQGYVFSHDDPEKIHYPIVSISEDIRKLQDLVNVLKQPD